MAQGLPIVKVRFVTGSCMYMLGSLVFGSYTDYIFKVNHNACSLHLATHFQTQTSHMGMFYMVD